MSRKIIPYTHWAYFPNKAMAQDCARELPDYVTRIDPPLDDESPGWLLRGGRDVEIDGLLERHAEVETIVLRCGGMYDGGEATYMPVVDRFEAVPDPDLGNPADPREE